MAVESVELILDRPGRKLYFHHQDLRDAVKDSGKSIGELLGDPFDGWNHLLHKGLRYQDPKLTLARVSEFIDMWIANGNTLEQLGDQITQALENSGFLKLKRMDESEGNGQTPS